MPTPSEQEILAAYNGWGGLKDAFLDGTKENTELKALLTDKRIQRCQSYNLTTPSILALDLSGQYGKAFLRMGFKGGRVLDPSWRVGNFFGCICRGK